MDICTITSNSSGSWNPLGSSLGILAQAASTVHSNQDAPNCSAVRRTEVSPPSSRDFVDSATSSLEDVATGMTDEVQGPAHNTQEPAHNGPAHNTQETDLQRAAQKLDTCLVGADGPNSPCGSTPGRICPNCGAAACSNCATITDDVRDATIQFLGEGAEWKELHCLKCQNLHVHTSRIHRCVAKVQEAISISIERFEKKDRNNRKKCKDLWYYAGLLFVDGLPCSGVQVPSDFRDKIMEMVRFEMRMRLKPSVSPWDGEVNSFPPELILSMAKSFSCSPKVGEVIGPLRPIDKLPIICYASSDLGNHPSAHLGSAELIEMATSSEAVVWVLCLADPKRLEALDIDSSPYRAALKESYGDRFRELGKLSDKEIAIKVNNEIRPNIVYVCGWHQEGVRLGALARINCAVFVQAVAHASTTGSRKVDYVLCNSRVLPEENRKDFCEKPLYIDAPFLPNSFLRFFNQFSSRLNQLRTNGAVRSEHRRALSLPEDGKLIANIAKPNRFDEAYLVMVAQVLRQNPDAHLVLVDHGHPAFRRRMEDRFKERISFLPFQNLSSGQLHEALAVTDLYLDTLGYNGHTATHDHLWANGVLVTVRGSTLASRIAADLLECFGTPENICDSADAAVARVNKLLQTPGALEEARSRADECRSKATMYDNAERAQMVIKALVGAYRDKLSEQKQEEVPCDPETLHMTIDETRVIDFLDGLGIALTGSVTTSEDFTTIPAKFRGVEVVVKIANQLNPLPQKNVVFREVLGRDGLLAEFGAQVWPRLVPLNELRVDDKPPVLDAIQFSIRGKLAFAVLVELQASLLGQILNDLGECWKSKPSEDTLNQTAGLLLAMVKLVERVHARGRSYGGEPRDLIVSRLRDGYGKSAVTYFEGPDKQVSSLLLGSAGGVMDPLFVDHVAGCSLNLNQSRADSRRVAPRARGQEGQAGSIRTSARRAEIDASMPYHSIKELLSVCGSAACGCIREAQRKDLRRIATAVTNAILGKKEQKSESEIFEGSTSSGLVKRWLDGLSDLEFSNATGLSSRDHAESELCRVIRGTPEWTARFKALFKLLENMLGGGSLEAYDILKSNPFPSLPIHVNAYPEGLESVPDRGLRESMRANPPFNTNLQLKIQHYWVAGRTLSNWNGADRKLLAAWLVLTWNDAKQCYDRTVRTAEAGKEGDFGAVYHVRIETNVAHSSRIDKRYFLKLPTSTAVMDGTPRSLDADHKAVEDGDVAQFVDSNLDERGEAERSPNCTRDWTPEWGTFGTDTGDQMLGTKYVAMGLKLTRAMQPYKRLFYKYHWGKFERESGRAFSGTNIYADLIQVGAPGAGEHPKRGAPTGTQKHEASAGTQMQRLKRAAVRR